MNNEVKKKKTYIYLIRHSEQERLSNSAFEDSQITNEKIKLTIEGEKKAEKLSKIKELKNVDVLGVAII